MNSDKIHQFDVPGSSTKREWAVYIVVAKLASSDGKYLYVGKVGDNRDGCNSIISRIGNHLSHTKVHAQLRNKLEKKGYATFDCDYSVHFATFGEYTQVDRSKDRDRINEMERRLNRILQDELAFRQEKHELLNPLSGNYPAKKAERERRKGLLEDDEVNTLKELIAQALGTN